MKTVIGIVFLIAGNLLAQYPTYPGCANLTNNDFQEVRLFSRAQDATMNEPMRMDFFQDSLGHVNIYWVERRGVLKYYDAVTSTMKVVGNLTVLFATESGLLGIALDPNFRTNRWIYLYWTPTTPSVFRLSRFTIRTDNTLDLASQRVVLDIPDTRININVHNGGALQFDKWGHLWITIGEHDHIDFDPAIYHDVTDRERSGEDEATDTHSLYGSVLRIHPESDGSYTIPTGNFGEYWSAKFRSQGRTVLGAKYADTSLVRPEVYVKGFRDVMSVQPDPKTGWIVVSDCGGQCHKISPRYYCPLDGKTEKAMLITEPGFHGWNYFFANNFPFALNKADEKNPLIPVNNSPFRRGVDTLPPAIPGTYLYGLPTVQFNNNWICGTGGYMYRYDGNNPSPIKFPPHFEGKFFMSDLNQAFIRSIEVDTNGSFVRATSDLFTSFRTKSMTMDLRQGPDGAMYLLNYAVNQYTNDATTGIYRIEYTGTCRPSVAIGITPFDRSIVDFQNHTVRISSMGRHSFVIYNVAGKPVFARAGFGRAEYKPDLTHGVYFLKTSLTSSARKIVVKDPL